MRALVAPRDRLLVLALGASVAAHLLVLALRFVDPAALHRLAAAPSLEVVLVNARSAHRPANAQAHAQVDLEGGGANEEGRRSSPLPDSAAVAAGDAMQAADVAVARLEQEQRDLLASLRASEERLQAQQRSDPAPPRPRAGDRAQQQLARMQAEIAKEISDYQKRPRVHHFMPSVSAYRFARYFEDWRARIERVGNANYPEQARGRLYGSLRMTVVIDRDGNLVDAVIEQSSGSSVLDSAARRIVKLSAPFPPFPPDMARDIDRIEITRSWLFTNGSFSTRADGAGTSR